MAGVILKQLNGVFQTVIYTFIMAVDTDRPVNRICADVQHLFQLVHQVEGVTAVAVQLVDKGKDRQTAAVANPEQLLGLRLYALSSVNQHDSAVGSHQCTVGILGEVLVTGGIQNVYAEAVVIKLQYGRGNGNTTLLFNLHPVGYGMLIALSSLYRACQVNSSAVKQQLFGKGCFTCVRVRNNSEGTAFLNFIHQFCHYVYALLFL